MTDAPSPTAVGRSRAFFGAAVAIFVGVGVWLLHDFAHERERTVAEAAHAAMRQSQLVSNLFGTTFLAADYVLRDMLGHVERVDVRRALPADLAPLLDRKLDTVPGLTDLVLLDPDCRFVAVGRYKPLIGTRSRQRFCADATQAPGQSLHIQYMPAEQSASGRPVVLMSRVLASAEGRLRAAAMAVMELDYAQRWIEDFTVDGHDIQTIVDTDGVILARNPLLPEGLGKRTVPPPGQPAFDQLQGTHTFSARSPLDNRERVFGLTRLERFPFIAIVGYDRARILEGWQQRAWQFALGYAALAALLLALIRAHSRALRQGALMHRMATTDALTGIANRRQILALGERETRRAQRYGKPLAVLMIDIDRFKTINDRWGHPVGDRVIRDAAERMRGLLRDVDLCGRLGGEEFTVILPETDAPGAIALAERLRQAIAAADTVRAEGGEGVRYTISLGVATLGAADAGFDALLQRADRALYHAKEAGRNRHAVA